MKSFSGADLEICNRITVVYCKLHNNLDFRINTIVEKFVWGIHNHIHLQVYVYRLRTRFRQHNKVITQRSPTRWTVKLLFVVKSFSMLQLTWKLIGLCIERRTGLNYINGSLVSTILADVTGHTLLYWIWFGHSENMLRLKCGMRWPSFCAQK